MTHLTDSYSICNTNNFNCPHKICHEPRLLIWLSLFCILLVGGCEHQDQNRNLVILSGLTMGTTYTVKINEYEIKNNKSDIKQSIENILNRINEIMSTYLPDSELSKFNSAQSNDWTPVSDELFEVIKTGIEIGVASNGAFDITIGPLVNIWGFGPINTGNSIPTRKEIEENLARVNFRKILLDKKTKKIKKVLPEMYIDLSGIAKGYAVDRIAALLDEKYSLKNYLIEIGGEISARGKNPDGNYWHIGIEMPVTYERTAGHIVNLENMAMASSGDYRNYFEINGNHYSHSIDPKTGKPVTHNLASVTVINRQCMVADAWATALLVAGPVSGRHLAELHDLPVLFISRTNNGFEQFYNNKFSEFLNE